MRKPFNGDYPLTQGFGENPQIYAQFGMAGHNGLDYGTPNGTPIVAFISGKIIEAVLGDPGYGNYIKIENDIEGGLVAHLQSLSVHVGDMVAEGQLVGYSDNTGFSTGPHLHWGYYKFPRDRGNGYAGYIDQLPLISNTMYKGYDLNNQESMKVAVDILVRVQNGEFVDKVKYDEDEKTIANLNVLINEKDRTMSEQTSQISTLNARVIEIEKRATAAEAQIADADQVKKERDQLLIDREAWNKAEQSYNRIIAQLKSDNTELRANAWKAVWQSILDHFKRG